MNPSERPIIAVSPAGGNEPVILGSVLAGEISRQLVFEKPESGGCVAIVPVVGRQADILADEFSGDREAFSRILLDPIAGRVLSPLLTTQGDFTEHLRTLRTDKSRIDRDISSHYSSHEPLELHNLKGDPVTVSTKQIVGVLDTGGRAEIRPELPRHFAFPVLLSKLATQVVEDGLTYDTSDLESVAKTMAVMESRYSGIYLPLVNTLAGTALRGAGMNTPVEELFSLLLKQQVPDNATLTPPLKQPMTPREAGVPRNSIFAMLSGTGRAMGEIKTAIEGLARESQLDIYTNPWSDDIIGAQRLSPTALVDPHILATVSRSGWGTGWQMLNMAKPWLLVPEEPGDDPEIHYNNALITSLGIGEVIDVNHFTTTDVTRAVAKFTPRAQELRRLTEAHFGISGPSLVARDIARFYLGTKRL